MLNIYGAVKPATGAWTWTVTPPPCCSDSGQHSACQVIAKRQGDPLTWGFLVPEASPRGSRTRLNPLSCWLLALKLGTG
jgi:hypothetical protein